MSSSGWKHQLRQWGSLLIMLFIVSIAVNFYKSGKTASGMAPALSGMTLKGENIDLEQLPRPVLVHFWATWCPICALEEQTINTLAKSLPVITVAMQSGNAEAVNQYMQENQLQFPVIVDEAGELSAAWKVSGVPVSFIIDADGRIVFAEMGYSSWLGLRARIWLAGI